MLSSIISIKVQQYPLDCHIAVVFLSKITNWTFSSITFAVVRKSQIYCLCFFHRAFIFSASAVELWKMSLISRSADSNGFIVVNCSWICEIEPNIFADVTFNLFSKLFILATFVCKFGHFTVFHVYMWRRTALGVL